MASGLTRVLDQAVVLIDHLTLDTASLLHRHYEAVGLDGSEFFISELDPRESP